MKRNTQRLYESIMKVVDRSVRKALNEQFNVGDIDFNGNEHEYNNNIFNKEPDYISIYRNIISDKHVDENDIKLLNKLESVVKPADRDELRKVVEFYDNHYPNDSLNWLDVSDITDMTELFYDTSFNGDISKWDVSNVTVMAGMFSYSMFDNDISDWDVSNVFDMTGMFEKSQFNQDISGWNVSHVKYMSIMFMDSHFNQDISDWYLYELKEHDDVFDNCPIEYENMPPELQ